MTHTLHPLPQSSWINVDKKGKKAKPPAAPSANVEDSSSVSDDSVSTVSESGVANLAQEEVEDNLNEIIIDANREVRAKLYLGQVSNLSYRPPIRRGH